MLSNGEKPNFFPNAQSPTINGGVMAAVQGNAYFNSPTLSLSERQGMKILIDHIASGAFHDASERGDPPKCHKDTRKFIIAKIMQWLRKNHHQYNSALWLNGPAGAGKSAILQTIAEMCALEQMLGGSFFFARDALERNNPSRFIATIVYQIVQAIPEIQERVVEAIEADQAIFTRKLATQVKVLIVRPLSEMATSAIAKSNSTSTTAPSSRLFVVDALDECLTGPAQREVLEAVSRILEGVKIIPPPFVFLISSRPEYEIRQAFDADSENYFLNNGEHIKLQPNYDADLDIEVYLRYTFTKIKDTHPIRSHLPLEWPTEQQLKYLVYTSSSQFIYAATAAKYIDSPRHNPSVRLNTIITPTNAHPSNPKDIPFTQLDNLYRIVLSAVDELPMVLEILTFLVLRSNKNTLPTIKFVSSLFGYAQSDVRLALTDMYALVNVPGTNDDDEDILKIHHASMVDFLSNASRSHEYYIDSTKGHTHLTISFLNYIMRPQERDASMVDAMIAGFAEHYPLAPLTEELKAALDNFNIEACMQKISAKQFYNTPWKDFFECLQQNKFSTGGIHNRIRTQFDIGIRNRLLQYPDVIQTCIPAAYSIFPEYYLNSTDHIFAIIIARRSDAREIKLLDESLLRFQDHDAFEPLADYFKDPNRAGNISPTANSFKVLAKEIVENICPKERDMPLRVHLYAKGWSPPYNLPYEGEEDGVISLHDRFSDFFFLSEILHECPTDMELAMFLRKRVLQLPAHAYRDRVGDGRESIGRMGLRYLKECGVSYREHAHIPNLGRCMICQEEELEALAAKLEKQKRSDIVS